MGKLLYKLPPLSPDYSGIASIFHDLGALIVIHDASGCTGTYTGYDEPRWFGSNSPVFCSGLREMDAIMGDDEKLLCKIEEALNVIDAPCVVIIGSPAPMVIGFDFAGFVALVEKRTGKPCLAFPASGIAYYDVGQKAAYLAIAEQFLKTEKPAPVLDTVNILGASVLDGFNDEKLDSLISLLQTNKLQPGAVWGMRSNLEALCQTPSARVNWVLTAAALPLAEYLQKHFGTPFVAGVPVGEYETSRIMQGLKAAATGYADSCEDPFPSPPNLHAEDKPQAFLIGEGLFCASLRAQILHEQGLSPVRIGSFFTQGKAVLHDADVIFASEDEITAALAEPELKLVTGDPLFQSFLPADNPSRFMAIPHRAVSGRLYT